MIEREKALSATQPFLVVVTRIADQAALMAATSRRWSATAHAIPAGRPWQSTLRHRHRERIYTRAARKPSGTCSSIWNRLAFRPAFFYAVKTNKVQFFS